MYRCSILKYCIDFNYRNHTESKYPHLHFVTWPFKDILLELSFWFVNIHTPLLYTCLILPPFLFYCYFTFAPLNVDFWVIFRATYRRLMPLLKFEIIKLSIITFSILHLSRINISIYSLIFIIEHIHVLNISETLLDGRKTTKINESI